MPPEAEDECSCWYCIGIVLEVSGVRRTGQLLIETAACKSNNKEYKIEE